MLDGLRATDDGGIEYFLVVDFAGYLVGLLNQTVDGWAIDPFGVWPSFLKT